MSIHILPFDLSSQISAGEVIERPASVIKEIIENSIDAGAKNINIEIENGGFRSISLQDDGFGIHKNELFLAITRHATSKINKLSDLDTINTFGFRGEALASIRAVSRLTIISRTQFNEIAWKIYSEGSNNSSIILQPIAHPQGTTIIVENLFYNMPVRLKFVKNKKIEFSKICQVVKKVALSHFDINFTLKHNKKLVIKYNALEKSIDKFNRLKDVLNIIDLKKWIVINSKINDIIIFGWISYNQDIKKTKKIQYCYVNNRYTSNNILINSIYSAFDKMIINNNIFFVLYLKMPSNELDINIHPTKNEIKFHKSALISRFVYEVILDNLQKSKKNFLINKKMSFKKESNLNTLHSNILVPTPLSHIKKNVFFKESNTIKKYNFSFGKLLIIVRKYYGLICHQDNFFLISFPVAKGIIQMEKLQENINRKKIIEHFYTNIRMYITYEEYVILNNNKQILLKFGFSLILKKESIILMTAPIFFKKNNINILISNFFIFLFLKKKVSISDIVDWFYVNIFIELKNWNYLNGLLVLLELEHYYPLLFKNPPQKLLQKINIETAICTLKI